MEIEVKKHGICIKAKILHVGEDLLIIVSGGDKPHIGSALLVNKNEQKCISFESHKDYIALKLIYERIKKATCKNVCLVGGIHIESITKNQIKQVLELCKELSYKIILYM